MPPRAPELRDIHVPHVPAWWPLALGWWVLAALLVIVVIVVALLLRRRRAWRRQVDKVLAELHGARDQHARDGDTAAFATAASQLLRRVARTRDSRSVTLSGDAWRGVLALYAPKVPTDRLAALDTAMYRPNAALDVQATSRDVEAWIRTALRRQPRMQGRASHVPA